MNTPNKSSILLLGLALLLPAFGATAVSAEVLYSQTFDNSGSERQFNLAMDSLGWTVYTASTGAKTSTPTIQTGGRIYSSPHQLDALVFLGTGLNITQDSVSEISFDSVQSSSIGRVRILVEIGTTWYASNTVFTPLVSASGWPSDESTTTLTLDFSTAADDWSLATLTPDSIMSISSTALTSDLPTGNITGVGLWDSNTNSKSGVTVRLDNVVITSAAIPEPATFAALAGGIVLCGVFFLRRRRA